MIRDEKFEYVRNKVVEVFSPSQFDIFLYDKFAFDRQQHVADSGFIEVVTKVLRQFIREGRDPFLVEQVATVRPFRKDIQVMRAELRRDEITELWSEQRPDDTEAALKVLDMYKFAAPVNLQSAGRSQLTHLLPGTDEGFQKQVRARLEHFDAWLWAIRLIKQMRRVCRVEVDGAPMGTGFLVGSDVILTNHHVLRDAIAAQVVGHRVTCLFDHSRQEDGTIAEGIRIPLRGSFADWHLDSSAPLENAEEHAGAPDPGPDRLDHALVRLDRSFGDDRIYPGGPQRGWVRVPGTAPIVVADMPISILQHPDSAPIQLAFDTKSVLSLNLSRTRVRYATNTEHGSSGAPCFDMDWNLVALHHFGDPIGKPAAYNQGVLIEAIQARLVRSGQGGVLGGPL